MSGTSLDGLDIALCDFHYDREWGYKIVQAETVKYDMMLMDNLARLSSGTGLELAKLDVSFGKYCGEQVAGFIKKVNCKIDFVASHGHTIFHQPSIGLSYQIGDGAALSAACGVSVVCDFRSVDVALGGQGAPLVSIGDELLFNDYTYCLNLGGIANISFDQQGSRMAFDISACNILFNYLAQKDGKDYDASGEMAARGKIHHNLLEELNSLEYYSRPFPKSLGREDVDRIIDLFIDGNKFDLTLEDLMATAVEHVAQQIGKCMDRGNVLITGGGAFNSFLVSRIEKFCKAKVHIPDPLLVNYKEALIFAFLGLKRWRSEINSLKSVTGAIRDSIGGAIYLS